MAAPKQRHTKSRRDKRRMHIYLEEPNLVTCFHCGEKRRPHTVCSYCGYYKGREVKQVLQELPEQERKQREQEIEEREQSKARPLSLKELSNQ